MATLFELAGLPVPPAGAYRCGAVEVKQAAFRLDGLMQPGDDDEDLPLVVVETQFRTEKHFYARWLAAIFLYLYRHKVRRPWRAVVVYPERATATNPGPAHAPLEQTGLLYRVYLRDLIDGRASSPGVRIARMVVLDDAKTGVEARERGLGNRTRRPCGGARSESAMAPSVQHGLQRLGR